MLRLSMGVRRARLTVGRRLLVAGLLLVCGSLSLGWRSSAIAQSPNSIDSSTNQVVIELFFRGDSEQSLSAKKFLDELAGRRPGIKVKAYDVLNDRQQLKRLWDLSKRFGLEKAQVPTFYLCDRLVIGFQDEQTTGAQIEDFLTIKAYIRPGCKHCKAGKAFLDTMIQRWPALRVEYYDVVADINARIAAQNLANEFRVQIPSFPCIKVGGHLVVGYQTDEITGSKIEAIFEDRSKEFPAIPKVDAGGDSRPEDSNQASLFTRPIVGDALDSPIRQLQIVTLQSGVIGSLSTSMLGLTIADQAQDPAKKKTPPADR